MLDQRFTHTLRRSELCGKKIKSEDDVLHLSGERLPTFNGKLSKRESELLLSYLTVPYLRIPLVLSFFSQVCSAV